MIYFDSDVIFNYIVIQEPEKNKLSSQLILEAVTYNQFLISTLVVSEVGYGLARFNVENQIIKSELEYLLSLNIASIGQSHLNRALQLSQTIGFKHINDCVHTAIAESMNCDTFYTYNKSEFKRIQKYTDLQIVIL